MAEAVEKTHLQASAATQALSPYIATNQHCRTKNPPDALPAGFHPRRELLDGPHHLDDERAIAGRENKSSRSRINASHIPLASSEHRIFR